MASQTPTAGKEEQPQSMGSDILLPLHRPQLRRSFVLAAVALFILWLIHSLLLPPLPPPEQISGYYFTALRYKFFGSGPIPYFITFTFIAGLFYLKDLHRLMSWQIDYTKNPTTNSDTFVVLAALTKKDEALEEALKGASPRYYATRFNRLIERRKVDKDIAAMTNLKNEILENDEEQLVLAYHPITWVEWTLPVLGFLGTVVGIGDAISGVKQGVQLLFVNGRLTEEVLFRFNDGFKGLAVAFDTTFQGLVFLVIIGFLHFMSKRSVAGRFARARWLFSDFLAHWKSEGLTNVVVAGGLDFRSIERKIDVLQEALSVNDLRATEFRENILDVVEGLVAESPELQWVRRVIFKPSVEFQKVWAEMAQQTAQQISKQLGHGQWKFTALAPTAAATHSFVAAVEDEKTHTHALFFHELDAKGGGDLVKTKRRFRKLFAPFGPRELLALTEQTDLLAVAANPSYTERTVMKGVRAEDNVFPFIIDGQGWALIVSNRAGPYNISQVNSAAPEKVPHFHQLSAAYEWSLWSACTAAATIVAAGSARNRWRLQFVQPVATTDGDQKGQRGELKPKDQDNYADLPPGLLPKQILALPDDEALILDREGHLHFRDRARNRPVRLSHPSWAPDQQTRVIAGAEGWFARAANNRLTMWKIQRGGYLSPYEELSEGFEIAGIDASTLAATSDGRYLLGFGGQLILTWEFPRYVADDLKVEARHAKKTA